MTFRFVHIGDLHLGYPFERDFPPDEAARHRAGLFAAFDRLTAAILHAETDLILVAGDVFDRNFHCMESRERFLAAMERFRGRGLRVFIAAGNHDPLAEWGDIAGRLPDNVRLFGTEPESAVVAVRGEEVAEIAGASHADRKELRNLTREAADKLQREDLYRILLVHANVGHQAYAAPVTPEELAAIPADYCALGHAHRRQVLTEKPSSLYCGNIYPLGKPENDAFGLTVVTVTGRRAAVELVPF